jgi:hypothetical protein
MKKILALLVCLLGVGSAFAGVLGADGWYTGNVKVKTIMYTSNGDPLFYFSDGATGVLKSGTAVDVKKQMLAVVLTAYTNQSNLFYWMEKTPYTYYNAAAEVRNIVQIYISQP